MGILSIFNTNKERGEDFLKELIICVKNTYYSQPKKKKKSYQLWILIFVTINNLTIKCLRLSTRSCSYIDPFGFTYGLLLMHC